MRIIVLNWKRIGIAIRSHRFDIYISLLWEMKYDINLIDFCAQSELILVRTYAIYIPLIFQVLISFRAVKGCLKYGWTLIVLEKSGIKCRFQIIIFTQSKILSKCNFRSKKNPTGIYLHSSFLLSYYILFLINDFASIMDGLNSFMIWSINCQG